MLVKCPKQNIPIISYFVSSVKSILLKDTLSVYVRQCVYVQVIARLAESDVTRVYSSVPHKGHSVTSQGHEVTSPV